MSDTENKSAAPEPCPAPASPLRMGIATLLISLLLAAGTFLTYLPALKFDFVNYDDTDYVTQNPNVTSGLSTTNLVWAFTTGHAGNWHPITWISHQADASAFGLNPGGHHLTNVLFHTANTLLLFLLLRSLTGSLWRSMLVAALFALHPAHVESVAWISERKDVLSAFFGLLALLSYTRASRCRDTRHSDPSQIQWLHRSIIPPTLFLALGLMAKPMLVTLPFVMLLLDYWPLDRQRTPWKRLILEKWPLFGLITASSVVTFIVQKQGGAVQTLRDLSLAGRLENAVISYSRYLAKAFWPANLATPYPHPGTWPWTQILFSCLILVSISLLAWRYRRSQPSIIVGWLWFLGMLIPVLGLIQVGAQSMADRYTYLPYIGIFIALCYTKRGQSSLLTVTPTSSNPSPLQSPLNLTLCGVAIVALGALTLTSRQQLRVWQDSGTLFNHSISVTRSNWIAWYNLGWHLDTHGQTEEAVKCYRKALEIDPLFPDPINNLGCALASLKRYEEAIPCFESALKLQPTSLEVQLNIANALKELGRNDEATARYRLVLGSRPDHPAALMNLGSLLSRQNQFAEAIPILEKSLAANPSQPIVHYNLANALAKMRRIPEAITHYERAVALKDDYSEARHDLGITYARAGRLEDAAKVLRDAVAREPRNATVRVAYGRVLAAQQKTESAVILFKEAVQLAPENIEAHANLGTLLAMQGDLEAAVTHLGTALRARPDDPVAQLNLARALAASGKKREAIPHLEEVLRLRPGHPQATEELRKLQASP